MTMDCMKVSTMDGADTHRCVLIGGHTLSSSSDGGVGIGVDVVGGVTVRVLMVLEHLKDRGF